MNLRAQTFTWREQATPALLDLLDHTVHGTNGARYRHLDTHSRIQTIDHPLFLSLERNGKVLGNATFCRRNGHWYIRYFAFAGFLQAGTKGQKSGGAGKLKQELQSIFKEALEGTEGNPSVKSFYAYIDPQNARSVAMSRLFGLLPLTQLATQTFSRTRPKTTLELEAMKDPEDIRSFVEDKFGAYRYFSATHRDESPAYALRDQQGEIAAFAKITQANWKIERLPGKQGKLLTKLIPYLPVIRQLIRPQKHSFLVAEAVWIRNNDPQLLTQLFEGMLHATGQRLIFWWVDIREPLYNQVQASISWGLLHRILGVSKVDVMVLEKEISPVSRDEWPVYVSGVDLI